MDQIGLSWREWTRWTGVEWTEPKEIDQNELKYYFDKA